MAHHTPVAQEHNWIAVSHAFMRIRVLAREGRSSDAASALREIEEIADRLHNVPHMVLSGTPCDAGYLLKVGVDATWPTGISDEPQPA